MLSLKEEIAGEHKGNIVLTNMDNTDDAKALTSTNKIYMVSGFPSNATPTTSNDSKKVLREYLYTIENKANDEENNEEFLSRIEDKGIADDAEHARRDFILIDGGEKDSNEFLVELPSKSATYLKEFLYRAGHPKPPQGKQAMIKSMSKWLNSTASDRLHVLRKKEQIVKLYQTVFQFGTSRPKDQSKKLMIGDLLGVDLFDRDEGSEEDEGSYFLRRSDLPCGCEACLARNPDECQSPFKKYMMTKIVRMKQYDVKEQSAYIKDPASLTE